jgi:hypothetical protein
VSLRAEGLCAVDKDGSPTLARDTMFGALSEEAGPQAASPARSIKLRSIARQERDEGAVRCRVVNAYNEKVSCAEVICRPGPYCIAFSLCTPDWLNILQGIFLLDIELTVRMPYAVIERLLNPLYGTKNFSLSIESDQVKVAARATLYPGLIL